MQGSVEQIATANEIGLHEDALAASRGDRAAWARLYERFGPVVHGVLLSQVGRADADDLTQEVFIRAMKRIDDLRDIASLGPWLCAIARNEALMHKRSLWRHGLRLVGLAREKRGVNEPIRDKPIETEDAMRAIRLLPEAYKETLILRLVEGLTGPQIAARTGMTEGSVRVNLSRGMKMLRERLVKETAT